VKLKMRLIFRNGVDDQSGVVVKREYHTHIIELDRDDMPKYPQTVTYWEVVGCEWIPIANKEDTPDV
jgi:hypothetical protein